MTSASAGEDNVMSLTDRTKFADLNTFMDANTGGSLHSLMLQLRQVQ